jgi:hypothetical protein
MNIPNSDAAAANIRRDALLVLRHLYTLPLIVGSPRWHLVDKRNVARPFSELCVKIYPLEFARILLQLVLTTPFAVIFLVALIVTLLIYELHVATGHRYPALAAPLAAVIFVFKHVLSSKLFRIPSPSGDPPPEAFDAAAAATAPTPESFNSDAPASALVPNRTFIAVPAPAPSMSSADPSASAAAPNEVWFYINGIVEQGSMVVATTLLLQRATGRMVNVLVNPSNGAGIDVLECILSRTLDTLSEPCRASCDAVIHELSLGHKVVVIAHSQGGIILSNICRTLVALAAETRAAPPPSTPLERKHAAAFSDGLSRVELYSFCSAADDFPSGTAADPGPFAEHFATELDFVSRFGVLTFSGYFASADRGAAVFSPSSAEAEGNKIVPAGPISSFTGVNWNGNVYCLTADKVGNGHLMKEMVLPMLLSGAFGHESVLWKKYFDKNSGSYLPIAYHMVR